MDSQGSIRRELQYKTKQDFNLYLKNISSEVLAIQVFFVTKE